ncbi:MAG TPA: DUF6790 family protein [Acetobacteraceae bacterium]|nr:DUF6790 family protein [Acetobacteraceae bacterium]
MAGLIRTVIVPVLANFPLSFLILGLLGAAAGHVHQMIAAHNFAPGNAGVVFCMDIVIPLVGFLLLWLGRHFSRA